MTPNETGTGTTTDSEKANGGLRGRASAVKSKAAGAYEAARERTGSAYGNVRKRTSGGIDTNPVGALAVGLALGAVVGALLPRTRQEEKLLGSAGRKVNETAKSAARSAVDAGKAKLDELGYNRENLRGKVSSLRTDAKEIAGAAAKKAKETARA